MIEKKMRQKNSGNHHANRNLTWTDEKWGYHNKVSAWFNEILKMRKTNVKALTVRNIEGTVYSKSA